METSETPRWSPLVVGPYLFCPKSGKLIGCTSRWARLTLPVVGCLAMAWFLIRVVPKPTRAAYPCQQVAVRLAWGFIVYLLCLPFALVVIGRLRKHQRKAMIAIPVLCLLVGIAVAGALPWFRAPAPANGMWAPTDSPNQPMGVARGINPGLVVWTRDPSSVHWDEKTGHWWDPQATDQEKIDAMLSESMRSLTNAKTDSAAWDALFRSYNRTHGKGDVGYSAGQQIVVKINQNTARDGHAENGNPSNQNSINGNPQLICALLRQLVRQAGVAQHDIIIYDISRYIADNIFIPCHREFPQVQFIETDRGNGEGRQAAPPEKDWVQNAITYSDPQRALGRNLPPFIVQASYMINMAIMKNHGAQGATLLAKNHFGTVHGLNHDAISPKRMGESNPLVDVMAHKDVGEKTVLFMIDCLYAADGPDATPRKWHLPPFGTPDKPGWPASLFLSQDGVALESVGFDFINAEWGAEKFADNLLHEAALANAPPSGKKYGPVSLGVHEHWNNPIEKQYSRNLHAGDGIELREIDLDSGKVLAPQKLTRRVGRILIRPDMGTDAAIKIIPGRTLQLQADVEDQFTYRYESPVTWSAEGAVQSDRDGVVTAISLGEGAVIAEAGGVKKTQRFTVVWPEEMNIAQGKPTTSSGSVGGNAAEGAVDGNPRTRWESPHADPQWLAIDLGAEYALRKVVISWEAASAQAYRIEVSSDGTAWEKAYETDQGKGGVEAIDLPRARGRFLRIDCLRRNSAYGYSIFEVEAYGSPAGR